MEQELFNYKGRIVVTRTTFRKGKQLFPVRRISKISSDVTSVKVKDLFIATAIGYLGVRAFSSHHLVIKFLGLVLLLICLRYIYDFFTSRQYRVAVYFIDGGKEAVNFHELKTANRFRDALQYALSGN